MILRIEPGWVQVNDALSRPYGRPRRRPDRSKEPRDERERERKPRDREALVDLVV